MTLGYGPLAGVRVVEFAGLGPAPFCGMLFSDLGADVIRIDRPGGVPYNPWDVISRGRRSVVLDLKSQAAVDTALRLARGADLLIEGFRPGVMERLGLGPDAVLGAKPSLVYGRMTGYGQTGPKAKEPGHDINYIALSGALHAIGTAETPVIPLNLAGDFGGGALYFAFGLLAALMQARQSGKGQVVDCAMVDGAASLMAMLYGRFGAGRWADRRESNTIDGGAHYYNVYECADGLWIAFGAVESHFYVNLLKGLGFEDDADFHPQRDPTRWPRLKIKVAELVRTKTRAQWLDIFDGKDACVTPVLSMDEAAKHPDNVERNVFSTIDDVLHVMPAPRFSGSPDLQPGPIAQAGDHNSAALADWGFSDSEIADLQTSGVLSR